MGWDKMLTNFNTIDNVHPYINPYINPIGYGIGIY